MDEDTSAAIERELHPPAKNVLVRELHDPFAFIPPEKLQQLRRARRRNALGKLLTGIGLPLFTYAMGRLFPVPNDQPTGIFVTKTGLGMLILVALIIWLILRGIYELMTVDRMVAQQHRRMLISMHPEIARDEKERQLQYPESPWPKRVIWIIATSPLWYSAIVFTAERLGWITFKN